MFDLGLTEIFVIAVMAIIVIAPKDLPAAMRTVGKTLGSVRRMTSEFQRQLNDAIRDEELEKLSKEVSGIGREVSNMGHQTDAELRRGLYDRPASGAPTAANPAPPQMTPIAEADHDAPVNPGEERNAEMAGDPAPHSDPPEPIPAKP